MSDPLSPPAHADDRPIEVTLLAFIAIIAATALIAALGGLAAGSEADPWYAVLNKAPGTPPGFVFGIVWPTLYTLMAIGACMVWQAAGSWKRSDHALGLFFLQLLPNLGWSFLFFRYHLALAGAHRHDPAGRGCGDDGPRVPSPQPRRGAAAVPLSRLAGVCGISQCVGGVRELTLPRHRTPATSLPIRRGAGE